MTRRKSPDVCVPEGSVLKPTDKTANDSWPTFTLQDTVIYRPDGVTLANVLLVNTDGPFIVRGRLDMDDDELDEDSEEVQALVNPDVRSAYIQIDKSIKYSIGCDEDLSTIIWVSGEAGWFLIYPHPVYASIYDDMCSVARLYHQLMDIYEAATSRCPTKGEQARVRRNLSIKSILFEYAVAMGNGTTYEETVDMCLRLGPSLLAHFAIVKDYPWTSTSIYVWLTKELKIKESRGAPVSDTPSHPSTIASSAVATPPPAALPQQLPFRAPPNTGGDTPKPAAQSATGTSALAPRQQVLDLEEAYMQPGTPLAGNPVVPLPSASSGPEWDEFRHQLFLLLLSAIREIAHTHTVRGKPLSSLSQSDINSKLYNYFRLRKYVMSKALCAFFRAELEPALGPAWQGNGFIKWLHSDDAEGLLPASPELFLRSLPHQMIRRRPVNTHPLRTAAEAGAEDSQSRNASPFADADVAREGSVRATAGKRAVLRLPSMSRKRPYSESVLDSGAGTSDSEQMRKMPRRDENGRSVVEIDDDDDDEIAASGAVSNGHDDHDDHEDSGTIAMDVASADSSDDDSIGDIDDDDGTALVIRTVPLMQPLRPTGPNRTWCCPEPGCSFFVRSAAPGPDSDASDDDEDADDDDDGADSDNNEDGGDNANKATAARRARAQIRAHLRGHEEQTLDRMGLAISEGSRGQVSVNHLLEKIRSLAEASQQRSLPAPSPIVRQFLV